MGSERSLNQYLRKSLNETMIQKLKRLRAEQEILMREMSKGFNPDTFQKLNIINHRINIAKERKAGKWLGGANWEYYQIATGQH